MTRSNSIFRICGCIAIATAAYLSAPNTLAAAGAPGARPGAEPPPRTTLSNSSLRYTVPEKPYVILRRGPIEAVIVDNRAVDDAVLPGHRAGYNGIGSLKHEQQPRNLFVPIVSGLNLEHIHDGTSPARENVFEPRNAPMELRVLGEHTAELHQPPTPISGLESCTRYTLLDDGLIELVFECIPRRATWKNDYLGLFWANYIHQPESLDIHFLAPAEKGKGPPLAHARGHGTWVRGVTPAHGTRATHRMPDDNREFVHDPDFPMKLVFGLSEHRLAEPWFFGECRGMAYVQFFRPQDNVRFTQSPSGGGKGNPAWDFQWFISKPVVGKRYQLVMRALYVPLPAAATESAARDRLYEQHIRKLTAAAATW